MQHPEALSLGICRGAMRSICAAWMVQPSWILGHVLPRSGFSFAGALLSRGVKVVPDGGMPHIFHGALAVMHADRSTGDLDEGLLSSLLGTYCACDAPW